MMPSTSPTGSVAGVSLAFSLAFTLACALGGCAQEEPPGLRLEITADAGLPLEVMRLTLADPHGVLVVPEDPLEILFNLMPAPGADPREAPILWDLPYGAQTPFTDPTQVLVRITALSNSRFVTAAETTASLLDRSATGTPLHLAAPSGTATPQACDADADGAPDCAISECCAGLSPALGDCAPTTTSRSVGATCATIAEPEPDCGLLGSACPSGFECIEDGYCLSVDDGRDRVWVSPGTFWMGCDDDANDTCTDNDEAPMHAVTFSEGESFSILRTEVSSTAYNDNPQLGCDGALEPISCRSGEEPAACLDWCGSRDWCQSLGQGWRLCTEAEWEYAARGSCAMNGAAGDGPECKEHMRKFPWCDPTTLVPGEECADPVATSDGISGEANYGGAFGTVVDVDSLPDGASPFGALHMSGNVWEWVQDCYHGTYDEAPSDGSAWEDTLPVPANGGGCTSSARVIRGGSFFGSAAFMRAANRDDFDPSFAVDGLGLRCCRAE